MALILNHSFLMNSSMFVPINIPKYACFWNNIIQIEAWITWNGGGPCRYSYISILRKIYLVWLRCPRAVSLESWVSRVPGLPSGRLKRDYHTYYILIIHILRVLRHLHVYEHNLSVVYIKWVSKYTIAKLQLCLLFSYVKISTEIYIHASCCFNSPAPFGPGL